MEHDGARRGWVPAGLIGMIVLVVMFEGFVGRHDLDALDPDDWQYHLARRTTARRARGRDVLFFGDSLMRGGVLPRVAGARGNFTGANLAICGSQAPASYHALKRALDGGAKPSAVVVDFNAALLSLPPQANRDHLPYLLGPLDALALGWEARDPSFLGGLLAARALPSLRARKNLRGWVTDALAGVPRKVRFQMPGVIRHWDENDGAQVMPCRPKEVAAWDLATHLKENYPAAWKPNPVNLAYVRRFLALAKSRGLPVAWVIFPTVPAVQEARERVGFDPKYEALVRSYQASFPNLVVIDGRRSGYEPSVFFDPDHLAGPGAAALSADLGDLLGSLALFRSVAPPDRWLPLPPYRPGRVPGPVETVFDAANGVVRR